MVKWWFLHQHSISYFVFMFMWWRHNRLLNASWDLTTYQHIPISFHIYIYIYRPSRWVWHSATDRSHLSPLMPPRHYICVDQLCCRPVSRVCELSCQIVWLPSENNLYFFKQDWVPGVCRYCIIYSVMVWWTSYCAIWCHKVTILYSVLFHTRWMSLRYSVEQMVE